MLQSTERALKTNASIRHTVEDEDRASWPSVYRRQITDVRRRGNIVHPTYWEHLDSIPSINAFGPPDISRVSEELSRQSPWKLVSTTGRAPLAYFAKCHSEGVFPVCSDKRQAQYIDFSPEPTEDHDYLGHVPWLRDRHFSNYMHAYGKISMRALQAGKLEKLDRFFYLGSEVIVVMTEDGLRVVGPALVTSIKEAEHCLYKAECVPLDVERILSKPHSDREPQKTYYYIEDLRQLTDAAHEAARILRI